MSLSNLLTEKRQHLISKVGLVLIFVFGTLLRFVYWFQNRNLFIDEVNVVRNLYERNYGELLNTLSYEQYAPPVFLWIQETITLFLGFDEKAVRLFPLLCGIASLFVFYKLLQVFLGKKALWYPLAIFSFSMILVYYSAMVKQYMPDTLIAMLLILFAKKISIDTERKLIFFIKWVLIGSVAVWSSMSAVFILSGVGLYYFLNIVDSKQWPKLVPLFGVIFIWLIQFLIYYYLILFNQIGSDYLQNFHAPYFLRTTFLWSDWQHNISLLSNLLEKAGGHTFIAFGFHLLALCAGIIFAFRKKKKELVLLLAPIFFVIAAAFLKQYTLIPRTNIFIFPLLLILIGYGIDWLLDKRPFYYMIPLIVIAIININNLKSIPLLWKFHGSEEITACFDFIEKDVKSGKKVYLSQLAQPAYDYYTQIHSNAKRYQYMQGAETLYWDTDYEQLGVGIKDASYFIFTGGQGEHKTSRETEALEKNMTLVNSFHYFSSHVFEFIPQEY